MYKNHLFNLLFEGERFYGGYKLFEIKEKTIEEKFVSTIIRERITKFDRR